MRCWSFPLAILLATLAAGQSLSGSTGGGDGGVGAGLVGGLLEPLMHPRSILSDAPVAHGHDVEVRLMAGLGPTLQSAMITEQQGDLRATTFPWAGLRLEGGASFTYRDRWMLAVGGGWGAYGYALSMDSILHRIAQGCTHAEARLAWHTRPRRSAPMQWSLGVGLGGTFQRADVLTTTEGGYQAFTSSPSLQRPYMAPELARFSSTGKDRFELALRYVKHLNDDPAWTSTAQFGTSTARSQASGDHLALMLRYHIGFRKHTPPSPALQLPTEQGAMDTLATYTCKRQRVTLLLWDDAEVDGDTVSVLLNGTPMLVRHGLGHRPVKLRLDLGYGQNRVQVLAHNEGRIPPNTARGVLRRGRGREHLLIKTSREHSEMLLLLRTE